MTNVFDGLEGLGVLSHVVISAFAHQVALVSMVFWNVSAKTAICYTGIVQGVCKAVFGGMRVR
jgi:hypothetical protein